MDMNKIKYFQLWVAAAALLFFFACVAGQKQYDVGLQLGKAGKYKESIAYLEQAVAKAPTNKKYKETLAQMKKELLDDFIGQGTQLLDTQKPPSIATINRVQDILSQARKIDAENPGVVAFANRVKAEETALTSEMQNLYNNAKQYIANNEWLKAHFNLSQIQSRFPGYEDSLAMLRQVEKEGAQVYFGKAQDLFNKEDYKEAQEYLLNTLSIQANHETARELLALSRERDNKTYFVESGQRAIADQRWDQAVAAYEKARRYDPQNQELTKQAQKLYSKAGQFHLDNARAELTDGWLYKAFVSYARAQKYYQDPNNYELSNLRRELTTLAASTAETFKERKRFGGAWFIYKKIEQVDPGYPQIFYLSREMEDNIKQRVMKSIAVFDFSSPSDNKDAGVIIANNLITFLFKNASGDIKILERENLKSILEEMKLGQIGVVSANSAKEMGRVYGIDVAIMGSVLLFKVDASSSKGVKTVRYQVGEKIEDNIEFLNWKAKHPNPTPQELTKAPPAKIKIPEIVERDYAVSNQKKIGFVQLSFRIVDVSTGENIQVKTIERKEVAEDNANAGLKEAGIPFDPMEIPTDTELLQKMTEEVVAELGREVLGPFQNLEKTYFQEGKQRLLRRDYLQAAESFVNAMFDEKMKTIQESPLSAEAMENMETIFLNYRVESEG
jgi:tetratricopeptide (TPR) repeat protein